MCNCGKLLLLLLARCTAHYLSLILSPGIYAFCFSELLLLFMVQQRRMLVVADYVVFALLQKHCQNLILTRHKRFKMITESTKQNDNISVRKLFTFGKSEVFRFVVLE